MLEERFRIVYLSKNSTYIKQLSLTWKKFCLVAAFFTVIFGCIIFLAIGTVTRLYHNYRIVSLKNDREHLQKELLTIKERVETLNSRLSQIEVTGDELRSIANLDPIDNDTRQVGIGGPSLPVSLDAAYYPDEISKTAVDLKLNLDKLEREILLEKSSMAEIAARLRDRQNWISHFPSIRPILGGRITSRFGWRTDPFTEKLAMHEGVDIPVRTGTTILATAEGVVRLAKNIYTPHKSYGREIVIDHGNGYQTRYAHLSKILVRSGQRVNRWEAIGEVGDTGRAEGPHLHYEVIFKGNKQNPEYFIYN
jgi:murein DD-endopeptidase MepM/ murein hydrolase activator NlpD